MNKQLIANMSWDEVATARKNNSVVIIPLGAAAKEHGWHLPLDNDYVMANYLRDRILKKIEHAIALPTINYHYYPNFLEYPGSTSLSLETSRELMCDICRSLAQQGFKKFYVLNTGFSTLKPLQAAKEELAKENIKMDYLNPSNFFDSPLIKHLQEQSLGSHADEIETSMMLYMAPQIVRMEKAVKDAHPKSPHPGPLTRNPNANKGIYSPTGAWGDPTLATPEKGKIIVEAYVDYIANQIHNLILEK
ncbi:MAG: creatininase family protein [Gammaproteobacteria bacterium]